AYLSSMRLGFDPLGAVSFRKHEPPLHPSGAVQRGKQLVSLLTNVATAHHPRTRPAVTKGVTRSPILRGATLTRPAWTATSERPVPHTPRYRRPARPHRGRRGRSDRVPG